MLYINDIISNFQNQGCGKGGYNIYNAKQVDSFKKKWKYRLNTKNGKETKEGEADAKKFINQDWVKFEKYELLKKSAVLVPMEIFSI